MLLWEFILTCDLAQDLSDGERARAWLRETDYFPHFTTGRGGERCEPPPDCWAAAHVEFFRERLLALRSLGARLKGFKAHEPHGEAHFADFVWMDYVRYLAFKVARNDRAGLGPSRPLPLDRANFDGLRLTTERPSDAEERLVGRWRGLTENQMFVLLELDMFFASAFVSLGVESIAPLAIEGTAPICGRCGRQLEPTPKGRKPRAKFCKECAFKDWDEKQPVEAKRERWKRDKRQQRGTGQQPKRRK